MAGKILKLDKILDQKHGRNDRVVATDRINRVGVELEGLWTKLPEGLSASAIIRDGSVNVIAPPDPNDPDDPRDPNPPAHAMRNGVMVMNEGDYAETIATGETVIRDRLRRIRGNYYIDFLGNDRDPGLNIGGIRKKVKQHYLGELPSPPIETSKVATWMKQHYPQHVNHTCGLHVHQSFKSALDYQRLMIPEYQDTMLAYLSNWAMSKNIDRNHPIWKRLEGGNEYCTNKFFPDEQAASGRKDYDHHRAGNRYTAISYRWSYLKTIECRVLPMFSDVNVGIEAVQRVLDITNACLAALRLEWGDDGKVKGKREEVVGGDVHLPVGSDSFAEDVRDYIN